MLQFIYDSLDSGDYDVITRKDCIQAMDGHYINIWNGLRINRISIPAGMPTRFTDYRGAFTTVIRCNDPKYFMRLTVIIYGGTYVSKAEVDYLPLEATQYLVGRSECEGGKGILDGNPFILRGAPEYTNVGATIDEPKCDQVANCMFVTLDDEQHKILVEKIQDLPEWNGFNHSHWNVVVTLKPLELEEILMIRYDWAKRSGCTYSYARPPRKIPVNTDAMAKGKEAKKRSKEKQISGLTKSKKAKSSEKTVIVSSLNESVSSTDKVIVVPPKEIKAIPTFDEVQEVNSLRLMEYYNELAEKPSKLTLTWCDSVCFILYSQYQDDDIPFTLQGSACKKILSQLIK